MMKAITKVFACAVCAAVVALGGAAVAFAVPANGNVSYEGGAEAFVFLPGSEYTDSDLFNDGFKNVMPGDVVSEEVVVTNKLPGKDRVRIYMRAIAHDDEANPLSPNVAAGEPDAATMKDFLAQLSMTVKQGSKVLFEASPEQLDGLENEVLLGLFDNGGSTKLSVELSVPITLGNEYADRIGEVDWVFRSEVVPYVPPAGDPTQIWMIVGIAVVSLAVLSIIAFLLIRRKRNQED